MQHLQKTQGRVAVIVNQESDKRIPGLRSIATKDLSSTPEKDFDPERPARVEGSLGSSVELRRKDNIPEQGRGGQELHRNERPFLIHLRRTDNMHLDARLRVLVF